VAAYLDNYNKQQFLNRRSIDYTLDILLINELSYHVHSIMGHGGEKI